MSETRRQRQTRDALDAYQAGLAIAGDKEAFEALYAKTEQQVLELHEKTKHLSNKELGLRCKECPETKRRSRFLFLMRKGGEIRDLVWGEIRPVDNQLEGYTPSKSAKDLFCD